MVIAICDDDRAICGFFEKKLKAVFQNADIRIFNDGNDLWNKAKKETGQAPDILLLDIEMKQMDGMELAHKLRGIGWKTILIFITAYADYVFDAFDVGAFHYLVKPVSDEKLEEVLHKASDQLQQEKWDMENAATGRNREKRITIKSAGVHTTIKISDILYAEVFNRKIILHTTGESIEYYGKLKNLEQELGDDFFRPHRAYLVNMKYVIKYDGSTIFLPKGQVMMAKQNYAGFVKAYMSYMKREYGGNTRSQQD